MLIDHTVGDAVLLVATIVAAGPIGWLVVWSLLFAANARRERQAEERLYRHLSARERAAAAAKKTVFARVRAALTRHKAR